MEPDYDYTVLHWLCRAANACQTRHNLSIAGGLCHSDGAQYLLQPDKLFIDKN